MSVRTQHSYEKDWYVTCTCYDWLPLFELVNGYELVYKWFAYLQEKDEADILSYVIMPNHFHIIIHLKNEERNLNKLVANAKRFMAYEIVQRLQAQNKNKVLERLAAGVNKTDKKKGQKHRVFEPSFDAKCVESDKFVAQKLDYIHHNPVSGKWQLVEDFTAYEHSSASFYELGIVKHFKPRDYREIWYADDDE
jgi:REP element-mobilizing transposase RayT